jgi:hypothetical protein
MSVPLESWNITPTCRVNRGDDGAWAEAVNQLRKVYDAQLARFGPAATLTLSIFRSPAAGIPRYVYEACLTGDVHNHGTEEGPGLGCPESQIGGRLYGACISAALAPPAEGAVSYDDRCKNCGAFYWECRTGCELGDGRCCTVCRGGHPRGPVPETPEKPAECNCKPNDCGDIRCHRCLEYVNVRCWNCKTPRGEGPCPSRRAAVSGTPEKPE